MAVFGLGTIGLAVSIILKQKNGLEHFFGVCKASIDISLGI